MTDHQNNIADNQNPPIPSPVGVNASTSQPGHIGTSTQRSPSFMFGHDLSQFPSVIPPGMTVHTWYEQQAAMLTAAYNRACTESNIRAGLPQHHTPLLSVFYNTTAGYIHARLQEADVKNGDRLTVRSTPSTRTIPHTGPTPEDRYIPALAPMARTGGDQPPDAAQAFGADWARNHTPKGKVIPTLTTIATAVIRMTPAADREDATMFLPVTPATHTLGRQSALRTSHTGQRQRPKIPSSARRLPTPMSPRQSSHSTLGNTVVRPTRTTT
ncbi:hypothetical protein HanRHA438_Chr00c05g0845191 [Helianthus annuus]|nr:hypothetical protein HanRHA438_Chr00c05g0845191 [Helianthus annuus]